MQLLLATCELDLTSHSPKGTLLFCFQQCYSNAAVKVNCDIIECVALRGYRLRRRLG